MYTGKFESGENTITIRDGVVVDIEKRGQQKNELSKKIAASSTDETAMRMRYNKCTPVEQATSDILDVLEKWEVTIDSMDRLFSNVKQMACFNTPIKNVKEPVRVRR